MGLASISVKILLYWIHILVQVHKKKTRFKKKRCIIACYQCYVQNIDSNISLPKVFGLLWNSSYRIQVPKHAYIISFHIKSNTSVFFFPDIYLISGWSNSCTWWPLGLQLWPWIHVRCHLWFWSRAIIAETK